MNTKAILGIFRPCFFWKITFSNPPTNPKLKNSILFLRLPLMTICEIKMNVHCSTSPDIDVCTIAD